METSHEPQAKFTFKRRGILITGGVLLAFSLYLLVFLVPDALQAASGPESMTLARAAEVASDESTYAKIEDGEWACDTIAYVRGRSSTNRTRIVTRFTEIFLTGEQVVLFASMSGELTCADLETVELTGYLTRMSSGKQQELTNEARLAQFFDATDFLEFCGYCGQENSLIGVAFGLVFAISGIGLLVLGLRMPKDA